MMLSLLTNELHVLCLVHVSLFYKVCQLFINVRKYYYHSAKNTCLDSALVQELNFNKAVL